MLPDLNRLRVFCLVYRHRSIQRAADELHTTRSAVSQQVKKLEIELGTSLFVRRHRSIIPTRQGEMLYKKVAPVLAALRTSFEELDRERQEARGVIRIGAPLVFGTTTLVNLIADFRRRYPLVQFRITHDLPPRLLDDLLSHQLDMAFIDNGDQFAAHYDLPMEPIFRERFLLVASGAAAAGDGAREQEYESLTKRSFVSYTVQSPVARMWFQHHFGRRPEKLDLVLTVDNVYGMIRAVINGIGLGIIPEHLIEAELSAGILRVLAGPSTPFINRIMLAAAQATPATEALRLFQAYVRQAMQDYRDTR